MKKILLAVTALSAIAGTAQAQSSVTLWGNVDAGVMSVHGPKGSQTSFQDGQLVPSEFGLKGSEDLGGGLKVGFALTGGLDTANGSQDISNAAGSFFGRESKVTLGGSWGTVGAGLQFDPALISMIGTEPRGLAGSFSDLQPVVLATLLNGKVGTLTGGGFDANAVTYTYTGSGLYLGLAHEIGGQSNGSALSGNSVGLSYTQSGFTGSLGYAGFNNASGTTSSQYTVGGLGYAWGDFAVRGQYGTYKSLYGAVTAGVPGADVTAWGIGMDWKASAANKLNLSYYKFKDTGNAPGAGGGTTTLVLMDTYQLSKRTTVFAQLASINADANPGLTDTQIYAPGLTSAAGGHTTAIGFGVNHSF